MKNKLSYFLWLFLFSCINITSEDGESSLPNSNEKIIELALSKKYQEKFKVRELYFEIGLNTYVFEASPLIQPGLVFSGQYDERDSSLMEKLSFDAYPNMKWSYEASVYYESLFPNKELKHIAQASVVANYTHPYGKKVPSWKEYQKKRPKGCTVNMNTYYFDIPEEPYDQIIVTHFAILETLHETYGNNYSVYAGFWPKQFLDGKQLSKMSFGFNSTKESDSDDILMKFQYLQKVLFFKVVSGSIAKMNEHKMLELISDYNKNGPDKMIEI